MTMTKSIETYGDFSVANSPRIVLVGEPTLVISMG